MGKYGNAYETSQRLVFNSMQAEPTPSEDVICLTTTWHGKQITRK